MASLMFAFAVARSSLSPNVHRATAASTVPFQVRKSFAVTSIAVASRRYSLTSPEPTECCSRCSPMYWNRCWPGSSWQDRTMRAKRRSRTVACHFRPLLPTNPNRTSLPFIATVHAGGTPMLLMRLSSLGIPHAGSIGSKVAEA